MNAFGLSVTKGVKRAHSETNKGEKKKKIRPHSNLGKFKTRKVEQLEETQMKLANAEQTLSHYQHPHSETHRCWGVLLLISPFWAISAVSIDFA